VKNQLIYKCFGAYVDVQLKHFINNQIFMPG